MTEAGGLDPNIISDLATRAIESWVTQDSEAVIEVLQMVLVQGSNRDALAFAAACLFSTSVCLTPGRAQVLGPVQITAGGVISPTPGEVAPGRDLLAALLDYYVSGRFAAIPEQWMLADDDTKAGAVGGAVAMAGAALRQRRSVLN